jgi:hypothetical protein
MIFFYFFQIAFFGLLFRTNLALPHPRTISTSKKLSAPDISFAHFQNRFPYTSIWNCTPPARISGGSIP